MKVKNFLRAVARFTRAKDAVSALEYAIVVGVVVAGIGGSVVAFTDVLQGELGDIGDAVEAGSVVDSITLDPNASGN